MNCKVLPLTILFIALATLKANSQCTLNCPAPITVPNALHQCGATVNFPAPTLSGSCSGVTVTSVPASGSFFPVGTSTVTSTASVGGIVIATCSFTVTVRDMESPVISNVSANPNTLWPPNHKMVPVTVNYTATDNCPGPLACHLNVTSNEPVNSTGDGNTVPDWNIINNHLVDLRAERKGNGDGRIYTIYITCLDQYGNTTTTSTPVTVAHDQGDNHSNKMSVQVQPNPAHNYFTINVNSSNLKDRINILVYDWSSKVVDSKLNLAPGQSVTLGNNLIPGVYYAQVQQGTEVTQLKLVKDSK